MGLLVFFVVAGLVLAPIGLVFHLAFAAVRLSFKLVFWALQLVFIILGGIFGGGLLGFLALMLLANLVAVPCISRIARR